MPDLKYNDYWFNYVLREDPNRIKTAIKEEEIISDGGLKIHLNIFDEENPLKDTIIFIHGTAVYSRFYAEACYKFFKEGYRVIAPDLIGHGISQGLRGHFKMERFTNIIYDVVSYALEKYKGDIALIGSSLGGITALYYAAFDDERIKAAVCHNAGIFANGEIYKEINDKFILKILKPFVPFAAKIAPKLRINVKLYLDFKKLANTQPVIDMMDLLLKDDILSNKYTATTMRTHIKAEMAKPIELIKTPIMLINGDQDILFSVDYMTRMYNRLTCKHKKLEILKNASHLIFQENIDESIRAIVSWLREIE